MNKNITSIHLFSNGNIAVFNKDFEQIPELQENIFIRMFKEARKLGYTIDDDVSLVSTDVMYSKVKGYDNIEGGEFK